MATEPFELYEAVLEAQARMGQGVAIVDIQSLKIVYANQAVAAMSGYTVEEILELPSFLALSPPPYADAMEESRRRRLDGSEEPNRWDTVIHRKDGSMKEVPVLLRIDTPIEVDYYLHGGILPFVLRELVGKAATTAKATA